MANQEFSPADIGFVAQRMNVERAAIGYANYNGDLRHTFDLETFDGGKGPNYMGEVMFPVTAEYDEETNTTKVGFSLIPPSLVADND